MSKFKDLLTSIDLLNTMNGGMTEPFLSIKEKKHSHEIRVRVPGIKKESLQIEIINNFLSVYYLVGVKSSGEVIRMPKVVYNQPIPYFVEATSIKASFEENELVVDLPFNELSDGYYRKIGIS